MKITLNGEFAGEPTVGEIKNFVEPLPDDATFDLTVYTGNYTLTATFEQNYPMSEFMDKAFNK